MSHDVDRFERFGTWYPELGPRDRADIARKRAKEEPNRVPDVDCLLFRNFSNQKPPEDPA